jgi:hypothetical protein
MCKPQSEGGQRCFAHASQRFDKALAAVGAARTPKAQDAARVRARAAGVLLASTPRGAARIAEFADAESARGDRDAAQYWATIGAEGARLREVNARVAEEIAARRLAAQPASMLRSTRANVTALRREMDAMGLAELHPLRAVLSGRMGSHLFVARDAEGRLVGGIDASVTKFRGQTDVGVLNMRVIEQRTGHGQRLIADCATMVDGGGELRVYSAVTSAKPFYAKTGATFTPGSSLGTWSPESVAAMKAGQTPPPGEVISPAEGRRRERHRLRENYPDSYRATYGDVHPDDVPDEPHPSERALQNTDAA